MAENSNNNNNSYGSNNNNNNSSNRSSTVKSSNADITSITNEASNDNNNNNTININNNNNNTCSTKRVIIGGIPGVGKTSVISLAVKSLKEKGQNAKVVVFGTEMFEEAKRTAGVKNRDELRKLSLKDQRRLQDTTAKRIAELRDNIVIVDSHIFVRTGGGNYYPGLPMRLLDIIKPTSFIMIIADATEIVNRRKNDTSRARDAISTQQIQYEIDISKLMVATCSILTGAPFIIIANNDTKMDDAVSSVARVLSAD
ncbi:MAG: adenylate kinase [Nitrososphaeraceae archaeon]